MEKEVLAHFGPMQVTSGVQVHFAKQKQKWMYGKLEKINQTADLSFIKLQGTQNTRNTDTRKNVQIFFEI